MIRRLYYWSLSAGVLGVLLFVEMGLSWEMSPAGRNSTPMTVTTGLENVRRVLELRREEILKTYSAVGVGIGKEKPTDASYVIVVYLQSRNNLPERLIVVDGVPLKFEVTGTIRPLK